MGEKGRGHFLPRIEQKQNDWLEPTKEWIKVASTLVKIARDSNLQEKKVAAKEIFGSNLLLGEKLVRASAPKILNSFGKMGGNQWDALRASHLLALKKPLSSLMVPEVGLEPTWDCSRNILSVVRMPFRQDR